MTRSTLREAGWQWRIPLQHRTGNGYVFSSEFISEDEAADLLSKRLDGPALADPRILRFVTGRRKVSWSKNCVALGLASGFLEPLESTSIHLVQRGIEKLLAMFPKDGFDHAWLIARFQLDHMQARLRAHPPDFIIAHYKVVEHEDTPLWRYCKHMSIPDSLEAKLHWFRTRGEVYPEPTELFQEMNWFAILYGQGLRPKGYHPILPTNSARRRRTEAAHRQRPRRHPGAAEVDADPPGLHRTPLRRARRAAGGLAVGHESKRAFRSGRRLGVRPLRVVLDRSRGSVRRVGLGAGRRGPVMADLPGPGYADQRRDLGAEICALSG